MNVLEIPHSDQALRAVPALCVEPRSKVVKLISSLLLECIAPLAYRRKCHQEKVPAACMGDKMVLRSTISDNSRSKRLGMRLTNSLHRSLSSQHYHSLTQSVVSKSPQ